MQLPRGFAENLESPRAMSEDNVSLIWIVVRYFNDSEGFENICAFANEDRAFEYAEKCNVEKFTDKPRYTAEQLNYRATFSDAEEIERLRNLVLIYNPSENGQCDLFRDLSLTEYFAPDIVGPFILAGKLSEAYTEKEWGKMWKALTADERMLLLSNSSCKPYGVERVSFDMEF